MAILITASINIYAVCFHLRAAVDNNARMYTKERGIHGVSGFDHAIMHIVHYMHKVTCSVV